MRFGAVIKFREGVTREEAGRVLDLISSMLDMPESRMAFVADQRSFDDLLKTAKERDEPVMEVRPGIVARPFHPADLVNEYDPAYGEPVWYVP